MRIIQNNIVVLLIVFMLTGLCSCHNANRHKNWSKLEGEIVEIKAKEDSQSKVTTTCKYTVTFKYKDGEKPCTGEQVIEEAHAELIHPGQKITVFVNPQDTSMTELDLPVPYPDKSGMNWRRMPKSLITKPENTVH